MRLSTNVILVNSEEYAQSFIRYTGGKNDIDQFYNIADSDNIVFVRDCFIYVY